MSKTKQFILALSTLVSTIIGVGFFALPYITSKVGLWVILGYFIILGGLVLLMHLIYAEVALNAPDFRRLAGYAGFYLKKKGEIIAAAVSIIGSFGSLLVYLVVGGRFLQGLLQPIFGGGNLVYTLVYFAAGAILVYFGIRAVSAFGFWALALMILLLGGLSFWSMPHFNIVNLFLVIDKTSLFLPYGAILFSLWGATLIPELEEMLGRNKRLLKSVLTLGILISAVFYLIFVVVITGATGANTSIEAIEGLRNFLGAKIVALGFFLGILTTLTSFVAVGLTLKKVFWYDLKISRQISWLISMFVPLALFLAGFQDFIKIIGFLGSVMLGTEALLIILMYRRIKQNVFWAYPLILVFLGGIIYELIYLFK